MRGLRGATTVEENTKAAIVAEAAAARGVTVNTARSHLRAILAKTNTSRQTELIRLLSSVLLFL